MQCTRRDIAEITMMRPLWGVRTWQELAHIRSATRNNMPNPCKDLHIKMVVSVKKLKFKL